MLSFFRSNPKVVESQVERDARDPIVQIDDELLQLRHDSEEAAADVVSARLIADGLRANLAGADPVALQAALLAEQNAIDVFEALQNKHRTDVPLLEQRRAELIWQREEAARTAKVAEYTEAIRQYRLQCDALIDPAIRVRRLAAEAGVFLPAANAADLLFDAHSEPHVAGVDLQMRKRG
ncbi:hypothetical protein [Burkholderia seminalis]|uniref:hypothetical protein n=1 Tax=Burkholderia seminalis TaxID=488731 RepID=UPI00264CA8EA|nr:hypothetical protein [Burkholderia seminalis]MDN7592363.1 hypothetical protein [Burkholderia seminalis]